jgi:hypothetical protein
MKRDGAWHRYNHRYQKPWKPKAWMCRLLGSASTRALLGLRGYEGAQAMADATTDRTPSAEGDRDMSEQATDDDDDDLVALTLQDWLDDDLAEAVSRRYGCS